MADDGFGYQEKALYEDLRGKTPDHSKIKGAKNEIENGRASP
jgi:hypothetical protein